MLFSIVWPQGFKIVLTICTMLFIGFNVYAMMHYDLRHFAACPRAFYSANGLLIGIAITLAFLLWLAGKKSRRTQSGNDGVALGTVAGPRTESIRSMGKEKLLLSAASIAAALCCLSMILSKTMILTARFLFFPSFVGLIVLLALYAKTARQH